MSNCEGLREKGHFDSEMEKSKLCTVSNFPSRIQICGPSVVGSHRLFDFGLGLAEVGRDSKGGGQAIVRPFLSSYGPNKRQFYGVVMRQFFGLCERAHFKKGFSKVKRLVFWLCLK